MRVYATILLCKEHFAQAKRKKDDYFTRQGKDRADACGVETCLDEAVFILEKTITIAEKPEVKTLIAG